MLIKLFMTEDLTYLIIYYQINVLIKCTFLLTHEDALLLKDTVCTV